ncbi:MAG: AAA family ATPase [Mycoplasmatales bacterium]|nr:AAA family ATPase [Mycoplasmatales bacterium]
MELTINRIIIAKFLEERIRDNNLQEEFNEAVGALETEGSEIQLSTLKEITWDIYNDPYGGEHKRGVKKVQITYKGESRYYKMVGNLSYNARDKEVQLYLTRLFPFKSKKTNGVAGIISRGYVNFQEFEEELAELIQHPNFIQVFEDNADIIEAIELYAELVNTREKNGSKSIPVSEFNIYEVVDVDYSKIKDTSLAYKKCKKNTYTKISNIPNLPSDAIGNQYLMLSLEEGINLPKDIRKTLISIMKNGGQLTISDSMRISLGDEFVKLKDFKIERMLNNKSKLFLFIEDDIDEDKIINIFDRLERVRSNTMLSVVNDIKNERINNNNLFQFLFNNGSIDRVAHLDEWIQDENKIQQYTQGLDTLQKEAFRLAVDSYPITFIQGPPGTGKTHVIALICQYYESLGKSILVSSQTNVAVENILEKLNGNDKYGGLAIKADFGKSDYSLPNIPSVLSKKISRLLDVDDFDLSKFGVNDILTSSSIVGSTTTSSSLKKRVWRDFYENSEILIIDEISKSSVPELIRYVVNAKKIIFVGDQRQLEPLDDFDQYDSIWDAYDDRQKDIIKKYISVSIFDKLFETMKEHGKAIMLETNRRSIKPIADVYSTFYDDKLIAKRTAEDSNIQWNVKPWYPFTFFSMNNSQEIKNKNKSRVNVREAEYVDKLLEDLASKIDNSKELTVAIISLYGGQVAKINELTQTNYHKNHNFKDIKINTVDAFQGDQADIVILSTVRADKSMSTGFGSNYKRINVALSRAKDLVVVLGNESILKNMNMKYDDGDRLFFNEIFNKVNKDATTEFEAPMKWKNVG